MDQRTEYCNIPRSIESKIGRNLHLNKSHPIGIITELIIQYFASLSDYKFDIFNDLSPFCHIQDNFDKLLFPKDHPARSKSDTYYVSEDIVLRTHTSAHQNELLARGHENFIIVGDVYRKDEINGTHYPVFHQIEVIGRVPSETDPKDELLRILNGLVEYLFPGCKYRINDDYFPFTHPSFEYEVEYNDRWLEILGCGIMHRDIVKNHELDCDFWALGLGLDRLAMLFFGIPDIRYLWSDHPRFLDQFSEGRIVKFIPYSELPNQFKDISFWIPKDKIIDSEDESGNLIKKWIDENNFYEIIREIVCDWAEEVTLIDEFFHTKKHKHSRMYRIIYSPIDPSLKDPGEFTRICNELQEKVRESINDLDLELR